jgi:hypothetical protein
VSYIKEPASTRRRMARKPSPYASTWWNRLGCMRADMEMAQLLVQGHKDRLALAHKLDAMDMRTLEAKAIVRELNKMTKVINEYTRVMGASL